MARCPPGVICIENVTLFVVIIVMAVIGLLFHLSNRHSARSNPPPSEKIIIKEQSNAGYFPSPTDVLLNPYAPPLKDDRIFPSNMGDPRGVPINISTRAVDTTYRQVGLLTRVNGRETILPLMGRPLFTNRDKWQFYTLSDKNNSIKLPVSNNGRSCTNEYGCDNLYNGDTIYVEGYNDAFKVTMYDNNVMKYIPFI